MSSEATREASAKSTTTARMALANGPAAAAADARKNKKSRPKNAGPTPSLDSPGETSNPDMSYAPTPKISTVSIPAESMIMDLPQSPHPSYPRPPLSSPPPAPLPLPSFPYGDTPSPPLSPSPQVPQANRDVLWPRPASPPGPMTLDNLSPPRVPPSPEPPVPSYLQDIPFPPTGDTANATVTQPPLPVGRIGALLTREAEARRDIRNTPRDPCTRFLLADMPKIHDPHPLAPFDHIKMSLINTWESYTTGVLIAIPFDLRYDLSKHPDAQQRIFEAAQAITQSRALAVSAPIQSDQAKLSKRVPISFLIYDLTEPERQTLLQRPVWSAPEVSFRVIPLEPTSVDLLFTIAGLTIMRSDRVRGMILEVWQHQDAQDFFQMICHAIPPKEGYDPRQSLQKFIDSLTVECLEIHESGSRIKPHFNVYADSSQIPDNCIWSQVRTFLASREYVTSLGNGRISVGRFDCGICHSANHPRGLCPFPNLPGWEGPLHHTENPQLMKRNPQANRPQKNKQWR